MATKRPSGGTARLNVMLGLTRAERRAFEALCASELRSPGQMATRIVVAHLAQRATKSASQPIPPGERIAWSLPIRLTAAQRRKLETLATNDGRTLSNYATTVVVRALAAQRP